MGGAGENVREILPDSHVLNTNYSVLVMPIMCHKSVHIVP